MQCKYIHKRVPNNNKGGYTIAYFPLGDNTYEWNYAVCSKRELFCKKTGRSVANGRFWSPKINNFFTKFNTPDDFYLAMTSFTPKSLAKNYPLVAYSPNPNF